MVAGWPENVISYNIKSEEEVIVSVAGWPENVISYNSINKYRLDEEVAGWPENVISYNTPEITYLNIKSYHSTGVLFF